MRAVRYHAPKQPLQLEDVPKRTYYLFMLPLWERRFRVAFDWTLDLLFPPDIVELKVEPLHTGMEALIAGSVPAERTVDKGLSA